jgi:putative OPT family oligopeptide transporter
MKPKELTIRGLILGALITTIFTAANVYLGLKVGLTFASSIPAAVISMAILSFVKDSTILENNIVQTVASAAGTLSAIIFTLPGLVIVGWWTGFPFWQSFLICVAGGVLGVQSCDSGNQETIHRLHGLHSQEQEQQAGAAIIRSLDLGLGS